MLPHAPCSSCVLHMPKVATDLPPFFFLSSISQVCWVPPNAQLSLARSHAKRAEPKRALTKGTWGTCAQGDEWQCRWLWRRGGSLMLSGSTCRGNEAAPRCAHLDGRWSISLV